MTHFPHQKQTFLTREDVVHTIVLIALSLIFCLVPKLGFGQTVPGYSAFPALDSADFDFSVAPLDPAPAPVTQTIPESSPLEGASISPVPEQFSLAAPSAELAPVTATVTPATASPYQPLLAAPPQSTPRSPQREVASMVSTEHPFRQYWGVPNDPQAKMTGKAMTVTELLAGTRSPLVRCQLLQAYWELGGLLAVYHFRCETERLASGAGGAENMLALLQEQRRTSELEFIKQQWALAALLKQYKGHTIRESELPIPADYPLYPRYQTYAEKFARTERTQYLGRMIPIQEQLIESKNGIWKVASAMSQSSSQPFIMILNQRTTAFLDLTGAVIEYNKMIAEYATETIPPNVNPQQLVAAVVRLPKSGGVPVQSQTTQPTSMTAQPEIALTSYDVPVGFSAPSVERIGSEFQPVTQAVENIR